MVRSGLSKEEKNKFSIFFSTWFNSQKQFKLKDISQEVNIPVSSLYDYIRNNKAPNNTEKANAIINFIKNNQRVDARYSDNLESADKKEKNIEDLKEKLTFLCQISELDETLQKFHSSIESIQNQTNSKTSFSGKPKINELGSHVDNLELSLLSLYSELLWFKNSLPEDRKILRKSLNSKDIGYITSLLRSMIKGEEEFNDWIIGTTYQLEMAKWRKQP